MNEFDIPADLASCPICRCLVLLIHHVDGSVGMADPRFADRRMVVSHIGISAWAEWLDAGQRWGHGYDMHHECPPIEEADAREAPRDVRIC